MKKIMFNDKFGLTKLVLVGLKTHTRRIEDTPRYEVGEIVAIAQPYMDVFDASNTDDLHLTLKMNSAGWRNKMFVRAEEMPYKIRITKRWRERLQNISEEDALKEGILYEKNRGDSLKYCFYKIDDDLRMRSRAWRSRTAKDAFACLIKKVSGNRMIWNINPEVTVYEFELVV